MTVVNVPYSLLLPPLISLLIVLCTIEGLDFTIEEATIEQIQWAFGANKLTSRQLVDFYIDQIQALNPLLRSVVELNPDAQDQADKADSERISNIECRSLGKLHGIPVLLKDTISTKDKLNTTAGSYALLGSVVARDATVVEQLRKAGAVILGKASLSEWYKFRSLSYVPNGWCARAGQGVNPYSSSGDPCGSSSGSAISVAANMVAVALGTETHSSIICPADHNSVVGFKPTVGLTSRAGVIPVMPSIDTIGPICRTVSDAVYLLDVIVGFDPRDYDATKEAAKFIPAGGYKQFLNINGLEGKRLGVVRRLFSSLNGSTVIPTFEGHLDTLRKKGAVIVDNLEIENIDIILNPGRSGELTVMMAEFKLYVNDYLKDLLTSPVRSLADVIAFNQNNPELEKIKEYGQDTFIAAEKTNGIGEKESKALEMMEKLSQDGFQKMMMENELDALVTPGTGAIPVMAVGGFPAITVPAGYDSTGMPFGLSFGALKAIFLSGLHAINIHEFPIQESTIDGLQLAFKQNQLTSRQLVEFYIQEIRRLNPVLRGVIEVNPDVLRQADKADQERKAKAPESLSALHGIPILVKDNIATKDKLNTTAGSFALLGSVVPRDAGVVVKLRKAGAIILGKANLHEWSGFRSFSLPHGFSARGGQGKNPYVLLANPCGSSSGSATSVAANMATVSLGTETDGSIICPSSYNLVVGIKPTVGLTSRNGVIPISPRQDTVGPICRTVSDAVHVLDAIVGVDHYDGATREASKYIPFGGYKQFLKPYGLKGKRLGIVRNPFFKLRHPFSKSDYGSIPIPVVENHLQTLRKGGAVLVDHLEIANIDAILDFNGSGEKAALLAEFKIAVNAYLNELVISPVRSLAEAIAFNENNPNLEKIKEFGQEMFIESEATNGIGKAEKKALSNLTRLTRTGFVKLMTEHKLDALVTPGAAVSHVLAIGGFPGISVPAGFDSKGVPFGICFGGLKGTEPKLIEIAYGFEQATKIRKPPTFEV